jgi:hypothetical protein
VGALGRAVAWIAVAIVFGASSWLLLMGVLIASLQRFGLSWLASMALAAGLSLCVTAFGIWQALRFPPYLAQGHAPPVAPARPGA